MFEIARKLNWDLIDKREICIIDLETTGLNEKTDHILEIGLIRMTQNKASGAIKIERFNRVINWGIEIPEEITKLTGIDKSICEKEGIKFFDAIGDLKQVIRQGNVTAYNAKFDKKFLDELCTKYNIPFQNYFTDTMLLCRKAFKLPGMKLTDVAEHLNIDTEGNHRADKDCEITLKCHIHALLTLQEQGE